LFETTFGDLNVLEIFHSNQPGHEINLNVKSQGQTSVSSDHMKGILKAVEIDCACFIIFFSTVVYYL